MRRVVLACAVLSCLLPVITLGARQRDRRVVWVTGATDRAAERTINDHASRGLRVAAAADGLTCPAIVLQSALAADAARRHYRVVEDNDLAAALPDLTEQAYQPRVVVRRPGTRTDVVWEQADTGASGAGTTTWRLSEFANPDTLDADLAAVAADGFRPHLLARPYFRSWPGLSEKGLILSQHRAGAAAREVRVLRATRREVDALGKELETLTAQGWEFDLAFTSSRDGSRTTRRERFFVVLSRETGRAAADATPIRLLRTRSWGLIASGTLLFSGVYWDDFVFIYRPEDRRQIWATALRLSPAEADCVGLSTRLRVDGRNEERSSITSALARPLAGTKDMELVVTVEERLGGH